MTTAGAVSVTRLTVGDDLAIAGSGAITFTGTTTAASIDVSTSAGNIMVSPTATMSAGNGPVSIEAAASVSLHGVTGGAVDVTANAGSISNSGAGLAVKADSLDLHAGIDIGSAAMPFAVMATTIARSRATAGSTYIDVAGSTSIGSVTAGGLVELESTGAATITGTVSAGAGGGLNSITLVTTGGGMTMTSAAIISTDGDVDLTTIGGAFTVATVTGDDITLHIDGPVLSALSAGYTNFTGATLDGVALGSIGSSTLAPITIAVARIGSLTAAGSIFLVSESTLSIATIGADAALNLVALKAVQLDTAMTGEGVTLETQGGGATGRFTMGAGALLDAGTGSASITTSEDARLSLVKGELISISAVGSVLEVDSPALITANTALVIVSSTGSIGASSSLLSVTTPLISNVSAVAGSIHLDVLGATTLTTMQAAGVAKLESDSSLSVTGNVFASQVYLAAFGGVLTLQDGSVVEGTTSVTLTGNGDVGVSSVLAPTVSIWSQTGDVEDTTAAEFANVTSGGTLTLNAAGSAGAPDVADLDLDVRHLAGCSTGGAAHLETLGAVNIVDLSVGGSLVATAHGSLTVTQSIDAGSVDLTVLSTANSAGSFLMGTGSRLISAGTVGISAMADIYLTSLGGTEVTLTADGSIVDNKVGSFSNLDGTILILDAKGSIGVSSDSSGLVVDANVLKSATANGYIAITAAGSLQVDYATAGLSLVVDAGQALTLTDTARGTHATLRTRSGDLVMNSGSLLDAGMGTATASAYGNLLVSQIMGNTAVLHSDTGSISDNQAGPSRNVRANLVVLSAPQGGIGGTAATPLYIDSASIASATAGAGNVALILLDPTVRGSSNSISIGTVTATGAASIASSMSLSILSAIQAASVDVAVDLGSIVMASTAIVTAIGSGAARLTAAGQMTLASVTGGAVTLISTAGSIVDGTAAEANNVTAASLDLTAGRDAGQVGLADLNVAVTGVISGRVGGETWLTSSGGMSLGALASGKSATFKSGGGVAVSGVVSGTGLALTGAGGLAMSGSAALNAGVGIVTVAANGDVSVTQVTGGAVSLQSSTGSIVDASSDEATNVTAATLSLIAEKGSIGTTLDGLDVGVTGAVSASAGGVLALSTPGALTLGAVSVGGALSALSTGSISLLGLVNAGSADLLSSAGSLSMGSAGSVAVAGIARLSASASVSLNRVTGTSVYLTSSVGSIQDTRSDENANVIASTLDLRAALDVGAVGAGNLNTAITGAITGSARGLWLSNVGATTLGTWSTSGTVTLASTGALQLDGTVSAAGVDMAAGTALTMADGAAIEGGSTAVTLAATGTVTLGKVTGGTVRITSSAGSILDGTAAEAANVTANTLVMTASGDIGTSSSALELDATALVSARAGRFLSLQATGGLVVGTMTSGNAMSLAAVGAITLTGEVTATSLSINSGAAVMMQGMSSIGANGSVSVYATGTTTLTRLRGSDVNLTSVTGAIVDATGTMAANVSASTLRIQAGLDIGGAGAAGLDVAVSGAISGSGRNVWLANTGATIVNGLRATGAMTLSATGSLSLLGATSAAGLTISSGAALTMGVSATVDGGSGALNMTSVGDLTLTSIAGGAVALVSTSGSIIDGSPAEGANITASSLSLKAAVAAGISGAGDLDLAVSGLTSGSSKSVHLQAVGSLTLGTLAGTSALSAVAGTSITVNGGLSGVVSLAAGTTLWMADTATILSGTAAVTLKAGGDMTLSRVVGGAVRLESAAGAILDGNSVETANITAGALTLLASGGLGTISDRLDLTTTGALAATVGGSAWLNSIGAVNVGTLTAVGSFDMSATGAMTLSGVTSAAKVSMAAGGALTMLAGSGIVATGDVSLRGVSNVTLTRVSGSAVTLTSTTGSILDGSADEGANVTAASLVLSAKLNAGVAAAGDLDTAVAGAISGSAGALSLANTGATTIDAFAANGTLTVSSTGSLRLTGSNTAVGAISLIAGTDAVMAAATLNAGKAAISISAQNNVTLGRMTGGAVSVISRAGAILDGTTDEMANISASSLYLSSALGLGNSGADDIDVSYTGLLTKITAAGKPSFVTRI
ncbi:beta strand repeat-containing protein [Falsiroseomonas stagni]|uniref:beta strand repeat-containing protein n=1 Tax=Falsiroseomonas stagni TaxID=484882 RepID=UPI001C31B32D|nr:hypothetical protein [Falsiroseomonas stagni]